MINAGQKGGEPGYHMTGSRELWRGQICFITAALMIAHLFLRGLLRLKRNTSIHLSRPCLPNTALLTAVSPRSFISDKTHPNYSTQLRVSVSQVRNMHRWIVKGAEQRTTTLFFGINTCQHTHVHVWIISGKRAKQLIAKVYCVVKEWKSNL